ncbi:hypothetical protein [Sphingomonas sp. Leaf34]|uniref:hypothetical protein n=1 Tax=Sphingomonas sp. Leaf34 TaxID=1736216 RepID=UPI0012E27CFD|nr:hypothetical protein [Sphingomonas sp. Leaf34]
MAVKLITARYVIGGTGHNGSENVLLQSAFFLMVCSTPSDLQNRTSNGPIGVVDGRWIEPFKNALAGRWLLFHNGEFVTLKGQGYFRVRNEIEYWKKPGRVDKLGFHNVEGKLLHVASGGGRKVNDEWVNEPGRSELGRPGYRSSYLSRGVKPEWRNEYFYLDGIATLTLKEGKDLAAMNYSVTPVTYSEVIKDVETPPDRKHNWLRRGIVLDRC